MLDDAQPLRDNPHLRILLAHYAQLGCQDRATWQERVMQMEGISPKELTALHGALLAGDWIEQNTGQASSRAVGTIAACYRITLHGQREARRLLGNDNALAAPDAPEPVRAPFPRMNREKANMLALATSE